MGDVYTKEDLQTDVDWLIGQGVDESEAEPFILGLLNRPKLIK